MAFADILYEYLNLLFGLTISNLIWCFGVRLCRQSTVPEKKFAHTELAPLRHEVLQALATSVLAPIIVMIVRALWP